MEQNTRLHERVSVLEANSLGMTKSIDSLSTSITSLNSKLDTISSKLSSGAGILAVTVFVIQAIIVPVTLSIILHK